MRSSICNASWMHSRTITSKLYEKCKTDESVLTGYGLFPQLAILGYSYNAKYYGISGYDEAESYLKHPVLGERLRTITKALLVHTDKDAVEIFGGLDAMKVCSCMTLFDAVSPNDVFQEVLEKFYKGQYDLKTLNYM